MTDISKLCLYCLNIKGDGDVCPHCKRDASAVQAAPFLPLGHRLNDRYMISRVLKSNGEGATYLAFDLINEKPVSVREFFPSALAVRSDDGMTVNVASGNENAYIECRRAFFELWSGLKKHRGLAALISVSDIFQENMTVYAVYDESETYTLRDYLLETQVGYVPWEKAKIMFMPVLSTLGTLHEDGLIHGGLTPGAFIFSSDGRLKITDFCISQERRLFGDLDPEISDGYAPLEQYSAGDGIGTWSDIYSFCAVLYRSLIGATPIDAKVRAQNDRMMIPAKFAEQLPPYVINAIINGMQIEADKRTRNVEQLRSNLSASPRAVNASAQVYSGGQKPPESRTAVSGGTQVINPPKRPSYADRPEKTVDRTEKPVKTQRTVQENKTEQNDKKKNVIIVILCIILACLLVGIGVLFGKITSETGNKNKPEVTDVAQVDVPNFVGMRFTDILSNTAYQSVFTFKQIHEENDNVESGKVINQDVPPMSKVDPGTEIVLYISLGPRTETVDDVTDKTYEEALQILAGKFCCVKANKYNDGTHVPGTVCETIPPAGTKLKVGETVQVVLWQQLEENTSASSVDVTGQGNSVEDFFNQLPTNAVD